MAALWEIRPRITEIVEVANDTTDSLKSTPSAAVAMNVNGMAIDSNFDKIVIA